VGARLPVIGVCAAFERARWSFWDLDAALVPAPYLSAVSRAGGLTVALPPDRRVAEDPGQTVALLDGLLLIGGIDVEPAAYGGPSDPRTEATSPLRDAFEIALVQEALRTGVPLLGICRGMQILNVALGGTLHQDLADGDGRQPHRRTLGGFDGTDHEIALDPGSLAAAAAGESTPTVHCHHHQAVDRLGAGLRVTGWAEDGVVEAIERREGPFSLGVQWHPEADDASTVIGALVRAAAREEAATR